MPTKEKFYEIRQKSYDGKFINDVPVDVRAYSLNHGLAKVIGHNFYICSDKERAKYKIDKAISSNRRLHISKKKFEKLMRKAKDDNVKKHYKGELSFINDCISTNNSIIRRNKKIL